ncbi:hypothetical protein TVAG_472450 [Trichomonas vaginalis G3]|uniref:Uncharacterized protein n=1 Tax=Trichomonas vaginalis (strain ATCC PRA-98 / G3) TaxID=412133 RepID=A2F5V8_TRIV3|nr:hypothetical protein TVAGG3_0871130 [Trichomonas vaginalis G3]EAX99743.1 hypothetical protein TVAG_472450 [Trichomonas vaginalis G3]KAI5501373.1 hypothetical protein TVAGG3_0871130 [Trichomonas vaginalis G3]|eukprot:XP_001312673.1 hypothetical protein [Trichomonas vaginalis G3]
MTQENPPPAEPDTIELIDPVSFSITGSQYELFISRFDSLNLEEIKIEYDEKGIYVGCDTCPFSFICGLFKPDLHIDQVESSQNEKTINIKLKFKEELQRLDILDAKPWKDHTPDLFTIARDDFPDLDTARKLSKIIIESRWISPILDLVTFHIKLLPLYDLFVPAMELIVAKYTQQPKLLLAYMYYKMNINGDIIIVYCRSAKNSNIIASNLLGICLSPLSTIKCHKNLIASIGYLKTSIIHPDQIAGEDAIYEFCMLLYNGLGMKKDKELAQKIYNNRLQNYQRKLIRCSTNAFSAALSILGYTTLITAGLFAFCYIFDEKP